MVEDGIYRSGFPQIENFPFLSILNLRSIIVDFMLSQVESKWRFSSLSLTGVSWHLFILWFISTWFPAPIPRWDAIVSFVEFGIISLIPILFDFTFLRGFKKVKSMVDSASNSGKMSIDDYRIIAINGYLIRDVWMCFYNEYINRLSFVVKFFSANHSLLHHYWFFSSFHLLIQMLEIRMRKFRLDSHKPTVTISPLRFKGAEFRNRLGDVTASRIQDEDLAILQNIYGNFRMKYSSQDCREKFDGQYEHEGVVVSGYEILQYDKSTDASCATIMRQEMPMQRQAPPVYRRSTMMMILARRPTNSRRCYFECDNYWIREIISLCTQYKNYRFNWIGRRLIHVYEASSRFRSISYDSTMYVSILNLLVTLILLDHTFD